MLKLGNRIRETTTSTGTGTVNLAGAVAGYLAFASLGSSIVVPYEISDGTNWEIGLGTVTDASPDTLSRDTVLITSAGNTTKINFAAGTKDVFLTWPAPLMAEQSGLAGGRLTLESGVACSTTDQTSKSTLYYTPYVGNVISLWNGSAWTLRQFSELSYNLSSLTSGKNYDLFIWDDSGSLSLSAFAWANDTTRTTSLDIRDGVLVRSTDHTFRYLGTFRTTSTTTTEDSVTKRFVWNQDNRRPRSLYVLNGSTYTYGTNTIRQMNSTATNQVEFVVGVRGDAMTLIMNVLIETDQNDHGTCGIGDNSTSAFASSATPAVLRDFSTGNDGKRVSFASAYQLFPRLGYSYMAMLERADSGTISFVGENRLVGSLSC